MTTCDSATLWREVVAFALPFCPDCQVAASLDGYGLWCEQCGESIDNGCEFDDALAAYQAACKAECREA